jgi:hypothetical protein
MMSSSDGDRSLRCPDAEALAAWSGGALTPRERVDVETHIADCGRCQMHLAAMARMQDASEVKGHRAKVLGVVSYRRDVPWWRWLVPATAVATGLLVWAIVTPEPPPPPRAPAAVAIEERAAAPPAANTAPAAAVPEQHQALKAERSRRFDRREVEEDKTEDRSAAPESATPTLRAADAVAAIPADAIRVERSADGRVTWQAERGALSEQITASASPSPSVIWLVGRGGLVLISVEGGWRRVTFPERADLVSVTAIDATRASVKTADGREFATVDGGIQWIPARLQDFPAAPF